MNPFKKYCGLCDRPKCAGHTSSASKADPRRNIRSYQSKKNMPGFGQKKR